VAAIGRLRTAGSGDAPQTAFRDGVARMVQAQAIAPDHAKGGLLPFPFLPLEMELRQGSGLSNALDGELEFAVGPFSSGFCVEGRQRYREPLARVTASVLASDAVEPALAAAGDREVLPRYGELSSDTQFYEIRRAPRLS
jgi:hypothetical protein